jgi:hypothetical protein
MHEAPVGAVQEAPGRLAHGPQVDGHAVAHAIAHIAAARLDLSGQQLQQGGLAGAGFADDGHYLALVEFE